MNASILLNGRTVRQFLTHTVIAAGLAVSGFIHARLYADGYRFIHVVGWMFLLQASASFAIALLVLVGAPLLLRLAAAGAAAGALVGFALSRTVGVFGFTERGWQPSPDALISVVVEVGTLLLLVPTVVIATRYALRSELAVA